MTNHHNRAPFPYRVEMAKAGRPFAAFSQPTDAYAYAEWLSRRIDRYRFNVTFAGNVVAEYFKGVRHES